MGGGYVLREEPLGIIALLTETPQSSLNPVWGQSKESVTRGGPSLDYVGALTSDFQPPEL